MRRSTFFTLGLVGLTVLTGGCRFLRIDRATIDLLTLPPQPPPAANQSVDIAVSCPGANEISVTMNPWSVRIRRGYGVEWNLRGGATDVEITAKIPRRWPFDNAPPYNTNNRAQPARSGDSRSNAPLGTYQYEAKVTCEIPANQGGGTVTVIIDPDVIITF